MVDRSGEREEEDKQKKKTPHQSRVLWRLPGFVLILPQDQPRFCINQDAIHTATMARTDQPAPKTLNYDGLQQDICNDWDILRRISIRELIKKNWVCSRSRCLSPQCLIIFHEDVLGHWRCIFGHDCSKIPEVTHQYQTSTQCWTVMHSYSIRSRLTSCPIFLVDAVRIKRHKMLKTHVVDADEQGEKKLTFHGDAVLESASSCEGNKAWRIHFIAKALK